MKTTFLILILLCSAAVAFADSPLEAPMDKIVCSNNQKYCAFLDYEHNRTTVYQIQRRSSGKERHRRELWTMPGWFRNAALADDGEHLIVGYDGGNLLNLGSRSNQTMLSFYRQGELLREIKLNQLIEDFTKLPRTMSHYAWCRSYGFDRSGKYAVTTFEKRRFEFDPATGESVNAELFQPAATALQSDQDAQIVVRNVGEPGGFEVENVDEKTGVNLRVLIERKENGEWIRISKDTDEIYHLNVLLVESCPTTSKLFESNKDKSFCRTLEKGEVVRAVPWTGDSCSSQCWGNLPRQPSFNWNFSLCGARLRRKNRVLRRSV